MTPLERVAGYLPGHPSKCNVSLIAETTGEIQEKQGSPGLSRRSVSRLSDMLQFEVACMDKETAVYLRVRHRDQSHASQLPDLERWAEAHDGRIEWFKDTFTGKTMTRPGT